MNKISVVGLGPGHSDYILPKAKKYIEEADILIGGERNLLSVNTEGKETFVIKNNLSSVVSFIKERRDRNKVSVLASGDPGFYSILRYLKKHFSPEELEIIPGISSLQYMFSKIGLSWEEAYMASLHGRICDFFERVKSHRIVGLLTDNEWTPEKIAGKLLDEGIKDRKFFVGENLSYEDEKITEGTVEEIAGTGNYQMSVVVIINEQ